MRTLILAASVVALAAASPSLAAEANVTGGTTGQMVKSKAAKKTVKGNTGVTGSTTGTFATELTAEECTSLGGTVYEGGGFCKGDKYCGTTDQDGKRHRVCLEVAQ